MAGRLVTDINICRPNGTHFTGHIQKTKFKLKPGMIVVLQHVRNAKQLIHTVPKIIKIRKDVTWEEVLRNWRQNVYAMDYAGMFCSLDMFFLSFSFTFSYFFVFIKRSSF
jgi:hypothetical protein